ncbi:MAG: molybdenum cofactor biosynthesis protein MoaE, partial [Halobacteriovoraceae bacterium]|nr:molybdenum cofactor biosynthesis protein MoaE [Halobacteriovoraceae bacterium]
YKVKSLEYQCYESMTIKEGTKIVQKALLKFDIHQAKCIHRHGHLNISDVAVWVGVASSHRKEAFYACHYIIDKVKALLPIWKKEYYIGKDAQWVACHNCETLSDRKQNNHE